METFKEQSTREKIQKATQRREVYSGFLLPAGKIAVELDGKEHFSDNGFERDEVRTKFFENLNIKVLRFENKDVFEQLEGVLAEITAQFTTPNPS